MDLGSAEGSTEDSYALVEGQTNWGVFVLLFDKNGFNVQPLFILLHTIADALRPIPLSPLPAGEREERGANGTSINRLLQFETTLLHLILSNHLKRLISISISSPDVDMRMLPSVEYPPTTFTTTTAQELGSTQRLGSTSGLGSTSKYAAVGFADR